MEDWESPYVAAADEEDDDWILVEKDYAKLGNVAPTMAADYDMDRPMKKLSACEEESWLEDYSRDENRYNASRGAHLNPKRAEKARTLVNKIPGTFGEVVNVRLAMDHAVNLPKGFAYVEFKIRADAEKAQLYMDGAQVDGKVVRAKFTLPERKKVASPPKVVATTSRRDASKADDTAADGDRDGGKRPRDVSPRERQLCPPRRRSPGPRRGYPR